MAIMRRAVGGAAVVMMMFLATGGATALASSGQVVRCRGDGRSCQARISIAGGASNRRITIRLTDTNLSLRSVTVSPKSSRGAYRLSGGRFALGGSEYLVTLNAVRANPRGSYLILTFRAASK